jgi:signal transduction histidine kinase
MVYIILWLISLQTCATSLYAQYTDHRNRQVDSLEQVLATNPPTGVELARIYRNLMWGYQQADVKKSMDYARKCVEAFMPLNSWNAVSDGYKALGFGHYKISQHDSAMVYYDKALGAVERMRSFPEKYNEQDLDDNFSSIYGNIGNLYNIQGKYQEAIEYYTKALRLFEKHDWKESQAIAYGNIGEMYKSMDNFERAEINFIKLDSLAYMMGDSLLIAYSKEYFTGLHLVRKEYDESLRNAEIAYGYYFSHPEEGENKAIMLNYLSEINLEGYGDDRQAEEYARQALTLLEELDIPRQKSISLRILSSIYLKRSEWRRAEQTALDALTADDTEPPNVLLLYAILAKAYAYQGNAVKSAEYFDKHNELQSSWSNKHYQSAIRDMEVKYETEKKETRIATLEDEKRLVTWLGIAGAAVLFLALAAFFLLWRWSIQKRRLTDKQRQLAEQQVKQLEQEKQLVATQSLLDGETQERTRLARDLHDGLGSILAAAKYNLVDIKKVSTLGESDKLCYNKAVSLLDDSMREMRRVAHHLMPESLSQYGLKQSVSDFCNSLHCVKFTYYGSETRFDPKMESMVYRTIHELVNNALKHAGASHILVQIVRDEDSITCTVQDDGCGFDPSAALQGMGLTNIRTRVAAYNGNLMIDSKEGVGTEITIELKIEDHDTGSNN